jgi:HPt (histidine-containing phosphotransfer) domain-containing protein
MPPASQFSAHPLRQPLDREALRAEPETADTVAVYGPESQPPVHASAPQALVDLLAQLASVSSSLEATARQDARDREQSTVELAKYEAAVAEQQEADRALAEARRVRASAEHLGERAFSPEARAEAARHAALARSAELACAQLLADRQRPMGNLFDAILPLATDLADELAVDVLLTRYLADASTSRWVTESTR